MEELRKLKLKGRDKIILDRLLEGPVTSRELARLIAPDPEHSLSYIQQVHCYRSRLRKVLEPLGWTIPRTKSGNPHYSRTNELVRLTNQ